MKKIPTLFVRSFETGRVINQVTSGCEWVENREGIATVKYDGTCCMVLDGKFYKRYEMKFKKNSFGSWVAIRDTPEGFTASTDIDENTGKQQGWVEVNPDDPANKYHMEAYQTFLDVEVANNSGASKFTTFELCGPKIQCNPEELDCHSLMPHGYEQLFAFPVEYEAIRKAMYEFPFYEGIVWHHPDGRMAKIKLRDFGFARKSRKESK